MKTLLLKFSGPLQAWGTDSHFETRHTDFYPSKSAVIGILAASYGYRRDDDENIRRFNDLGFAVRVDHAGYLLRDYHTAHKYKTNGNLDRTYVTNRYYLTDAVMLVALESEDDDFIFDMEEKLNYPYFQPFMGRRSLPLSYDFILGVKDGAAIDNLKKTPWQGVKKHLGYSNRRELLIDIYADSRLLKNREARPRKDQVISFSQKNRQFTYRMEANIKIKLPNPYYQERQEAVFLEEHDAFKALGGEDVFIESSN